nr:MAG TPA: hypothetical protein [Caudoviricetes sp.]
MTCKYPITSRSYKFCIGCSYIDCCEDAVTPDIPMPEVQSPKNVIPSASEANKMTNNAIDNRTIQQLAELSKLIRDAIADGKFSISEDGCLKPETRTKLEGLGYKVETGTQYNEPYYSISWRKTK